MNKDRMDISFSGKTLLNLSKLVETLCAKNPGDRGIEFELKLRLPGDIKNQEKNGHHLHRAR